MASLSLIPIVGHSHTMMIRCSKGLETYNKDNCVSIAGAQAAACLGEMTLFASIIVTTLLSLNYVRRKAEPTVAWWAIALSCK